MKYESLITYHSKDIANVKVFFFFSDRQTKTDRPKTIQTDKERQTDRPKTICPYLSIWGHKNISRWNSSQQFGQYKIPL
jgi:hypothetical protein